MLSLLTLMCVPLLACADGPKGLPAEWHGTWKGTLAEIGEAKGHAIEVTIAPKAKSKEVLLTIAQDKNTKGQWVRKYNLLPNPPKDSKVKDASEKPNRRIEDQSTSSVTSQFSGTVLWLKEKEWSKSWTWIQTPGGLHRNENQHEELATYRFELRDGSLRLEQSTDRVFGAAFKLAELKPVK